MPGARGPSGPGLFFVDDYGDEVSPGYIVGSGGDDTAAIVAAGIAAAAGQATLHFYPGKTYTFSQWATPNNLSINAVGAILRSDGSLTTAGDITLDIGNNVTVDALTVSTPGTETNTDIIRLGSNFTADRLAVISDAQRAGGGIICTGDNAQIALLKTRKIDRPIHFNNTSVVAQTTGSYIGHIDARDYVRVFRADFCSFEVGGIWAVGRSPNASKSPGHNVVLIVGCANWTIGDVYSEDCGEHVVRIGGSTGSHMVTKNYSIGIITAIRCGGCPFKVNPTLLVSAGVTEKAYNGFVKGVVGTNVGDPADAGNEELLRLTHVNGLTIGFAHAYVDGDAVSAQYLLQINDANGVSIGELGGGAASAGFVYINGASDCDEINQFGGDVTALRIGRLLGVCNGTNAIGVDTAFDVARVHIGLDGIRGQTTNVLRWIAGTPTDDFELTGWVSGSVAPVYQDAPDSPFFLTSVRYEDKYVDGPGLYGRYTATREIIAAVFGAGNQAPTGLFINGARATAGAGNYGAGLEMSRAGSGRRGAAIVPRQATADNNETDLDFFVGDTAADTNETLTLALRLRYTGVPHAPLLPAHADNAAASGAGLVVGDIYKTATGEVRVVV